MGSLAGNERRRGDVQGLRAIAILTVVAFHAFPGFAPGGYVGVDVFFVISGFLITGILLREHARSGRISLSRFYARRVRRLMPAMLLVTIVTLIVASFRLDPVALARTFGDAAWATLSLANLHFSASPAGDYFANASPSPFLHFWSLSVEEQFYLFMPLLLIAVLLLRRSWAVPALIATVFAGSLVASIVLTAEANRGAYYSLGTRAFELAIGGALAWTIGRSLTVRTPQWTRPLAFALGIGAIATATWAFSRETPFPGVAALLPTIGTAAVIWSGTGGSPGSIGRLLDNPVARYIGDISFSLYLWHWPLLVLQPSQFRGDAWMQLVLVAAAFGLAALTYRFIEKPFQYLRPQARPVRILVLGLPSAVAVAAIAFVLATSPTAIGRVPPLPAQYETLASGPGGMPQGIPENVSPALVDISYDLQDVYFDCYREPLTICTSGDRGSDTSILLTGDSFAGMWYPAFEQSAFEHGWRLEFISKAGCPLVVSPDPTPDSGRQWVDCVGWQRAALESARTLAPDVIVWTNSMIGLGGESARGWEDGALKMLQELARVAPVIVIGATPGFPATSEACLGMNLSDPSACNVPIERAVPQEGRDIAKRISDGSGAALIDLTGILCANDECPMIADNVLMYRDAGHISDTYARHFAKVFGDVLTEYLT